MFSKTARNMTRRVFFTSTGAAALSVGSAATARVPPGTDISYTYEVTRSEDEWIAMLNGEEYAIMREGYTESPKSSPLWEETRPGTYLCKGCDLPVFEGNWKVVLEKGWVFFEHAVPGSVMSNVDGPTPEYGAMADGKKAVIEKHCRRCGSHLGHLLIVDFDLLYCINGASLTFEAQTA